MTLNVNHSHSRKPVVRRRFSVRESESKCDSEVSDRQALKKQEIDNLKARTVRNRVLVVDLISES
jgi:hypothetical protein